MNVNAAVLVVLLYYTRATVVVSLRRLSGRYPGLQVLWDAVSVKTVMCSSGQGSCTLVYDIASRRVAAADSVVAFLIGQCCPALQWRRL